MSDTFPDETLYPVLEALADEDRIFASNSAAGHESSQIKGSTIKGLINALKGTPPETLDTLAKLASALAGKQDASNAMTTDTPQYVTGIKTFAVPFVNQASTTSNFNVFSIGAVGGVVWYLQYQPASKTLRWFTTKDGLYPSPMQFLWDSDGKVLTDFPASPLVPSPSDADTSQKAAPTAWVLARISEAIAALPPASGVPAGVICMWSGTIATVPTGWALCDGANGTPDLVDRFVVAAGDQYDPGDTGGLDSVTLALTQIPAHSHDGTAHEHHGGIDCAHQHEIRVYVWDGASGSSYMIDRRDNTSETSGYFLTNGGFTPFDGRHAHFVTTISKGGGGAHENRPPYYALAFIMKL